MIAAVTRRAGLDLVDTVITALKENDQLSVEFTPVLLLSVLKTDESDFEEAYDTASKHFLDKIVLFDEPALGDTAIKLLTCVNAMCDEVNLRAGIQLALATFKEISEAAKWDAHGKFLEIFAQLFHEKPADAMAKVCNVNIM